MAQPYVRGMVKKTEAQHAKHLMRGQHQSITTICFVACAYSNMFCCMRIQGMLSLGCVSKFYLLYISQPVHGPLCFIMTKALP